MCVQIGLGRITRETALLLNAHLFFLNQMLAACLIPSRHLSRRITCPGTENPTSTALCLGMSEAVAGDIRKSCGSRYSTGVSDVIVLHTVNECARQSVTVNDEILPLVGK
jgi:hypothetical protein